MHKIIILMFSIIVSITAQAKPDRKGSSDHELLSRYPNFYIKSYAQHQYDEAKIIVGQYDRKNKKLPMRVLEGKITNINYKNSDVHTSVTSFQLFKNYENALKKLNAEFIYSCRNKKCLASNSQNSNGQSIGLVVHNDSLLFKGINAKVEREFGILTAKIRQDGGKDVYVMVTVSADVNNKSRTVNLSVIEPQLLDSDVLTIGSVDDLDNKVSKTGKVELVGIYFDSDKSVVKPESEESLEIIAQYLKSKPKDQFFVVGHTDTKGTYSYNVNLSKKRALAVIQELNKRYKVNDSNLQAIGVGPVSPETSNKDELGRASNRRVELVLSTSY